MNITQILGNLGLDPEVRFTPSGQKVIKLSVATNSKKSGKEETTWWNVTIWEDRCNIEKMLPYLKKGSSLVIVGEMQARLYEDKEGKSRISHDLTADSVRFSPFGKPDSNKQEGAPGNQQAYGQQNFSKQPQPQNENAFASQSGSYGSNQGHFGGSSYGQNDSSSLADDDNIPF